jgi:very-short-patch-repair endonuclease
MRTNQEEIKHNYLVERIEKGDFKLKETIVVSSLCFDFRLKNIKPLFQYSILKENGIGFYFYDLYYEQINVVVEINEEYHESASQKLLDKEKEDWAKTKLNCEYLKICFHQQYGTIAGQIEAVVTKILAEISKVGVEKTFWHENQFNPFDYIKEQTKTIIVSVSEKNKIDNLNELPLQIKRDFAKIDNLTIIYLTGRTSSVATVYHVSAADWIVNNNSLFHTGKMDLTNSIIKSGSTFYNENKNIIFSPDLR